MERNQDKSIHSSLHRFIVVLFMFECLQHFDYSPLFANYKYKFYNDNELKKTNSTKLYKYGIQTLRNGRTNGSMGT